MLSTNSATVICQMEIPINSNNNTIRNKNDPFDFLFTKADFEFIKLISKCNNFYRKF